MLQVADLTTRIYYVSLEEALAVKVMLVVVELAVFELSLKNLLLEKHIQQPLETVVLQPLLMDQEIKE